MIDDPTNQQIKLRDGRTLAYAEFGDPRGTPVIHNHGYNKSRLEGHMFGDALDKAGVRLIVPDRPGMGNSTFQRGRKLLDWPDDVITLADALEIETFALLGVSGGGPYTAACAYKIPERLSNIGIVVGIGPPHAPGAREGASWVLPSKHDLIRSMMLFFMSQLVKRSPERFAAQAIASVAAPDRALLGEPEFQSTFILDTQESYSQGGRGNAHEGGIYKRPWGFDISQIQSKVHLWYGEQDLLVLPSVGRYWAEQLPNNEVVVWPDEGHISWGEKHMDDILNALIS